MKSFVSAAVAGLWLIASLNSVQAQSQDDTLRRLEAKLDALAKENAALRSRVNQIEASRQPATTARPVATGHPATASTSKPVAVLDPARDAYAANLPVKAALSSGCPAARFQGWHAGVDTGVVNYTANRTDRDAYLIGFAGPEFSTFVAKEWGGSVGGHVGYNWARCNALWGFEVDANWASATASTSIFNFPGFNGDVKSELNGFATARARGGIVVDNLLLYVTGGLATAHTRTTWSSNFAGLGVLEAVSAGKWGIGWVAGFGTEWAINDRLSVRSEALYIDIMDQDYALASPVFLIVNGFIPSFKNSDSMWIARLGANYKFAN